MDAEYDPDVLGDLMWCYVGSDGGESDDDARSDISVDYGYTGATIPSRQRAVWSLVGVYETKEAAMIAKDTYDSYKHPYHGRYNSIWAIGTTYPCKSHAGCKHDLKIVLLVRSGKFELRQNGAHARKIIRLVQYGICAGVKADVDRLIEIGMTPEKIRPFLLLKHKQDVNMLKTIPESKQVANRRAYVVRTWIGGWELKTFASLMEWASTKMCETRQALEALNDTFDEANRLLVLWCFQHSYVDSETKKSDFLRSRLFVTQLLGEPCRRDSSSRIGFESDHGRDIPYPLRWVDTRRLWCHVRCVERPRELREQVCTVCVHVCSHGVCLCVRANVPYDDLSC